LIKVDKLLKECRLQMLAKAYKLCVCIVGSQKSEFSISMLVLYLASDFMQTKKSGPWYFRFWNVSSTLSWII